MTPLNARPNKNSEETMERERRTRDRRFTDGEVEEILGILNDMLPQEKEHIAKASSGFFTLGISLSAVIGITTLIQTFYLSPIQQEMEEIEGRLMTLDVSVRQHHENSAKEYVSKNDYDRDMTRVLSELSELKGMMLRFDKK